MCRPLYSKQKPSEAEAMETRSMRASVAQDPGLLYHRLVAPKEKIWAGASPGLAGSNAALLLSSASRRGTSRKGNSQTAMSLAVRSLLQGPARAHRPYYSSHSHVKLAAQTWRKMAAGRPAA